MFSYILLLATNPLRKNNFEFHHQTHQWYSCKTCCLDICMWLVLDRLLFHWRGISRIVLKRQMIQLNSMILNYVNFIYKLLLYHLRITIYTFEIFISFFCFVVYLFIHKVIFQLWRNCDKTDDSLESMKKYYQIHTLVTEMTKSCSSKLEFNYGNDRILDILWKYFQN